MRNLLQHFFVNRSRANLFALVCAILVGFVGGEINRSRAEKQYQLFLDSQVQKVLLRLESETMRSSAMAVAALLGLTEPLIKKQALGLLRLDDPAVLNRLGMARSMLRADGIYIMNKEGLVVAHAAVKDRFTGMNFSFRPYWQQAMNGIQNVYPAVGTVSGKRGLYVAAPIRSGNNESDSVVGVIVVKVSGEYLDSLFSTFSGKLIMMSPQGVVFASSDTTWLYRPVMKLSEQAYAEIRKRKQFGPSFEKEAGSVMPIFDLNEEELEINEEHYVKAVAPLQLNDPAGKWSLVLISPTNKAFSLIDRLLIGMVYGGVIWIVFMLGLRAVRYSVASQEALNRSEDAAKELQMAIEMKERHAEFTERMQKARDVASMTATFFDEVAVFIPIHQGSLYFIETNEEEKQQLVLGGSYGTVHVPARIALGEGVMGQCAIDRKIKFLTAVPDGFWRIASGLGSSMPHSLLLMPVQSGEHFLGVVEIASLSTDFDHARPLLESMMPTLAMNLEILIAEKRTQHMLLEAQTNAETYKAWQEVGRQGENWLLAVIDQAPDGILVVEEGGTIVLSNHAIENMLGFERSALQAMHVEALFIADRQNGAFKLAALLADIPDGAQQTLVWQPGFKLQGKKQAPVSVSILISRLPAMGLHELGICIVARPT